MALWGLRSLCCIHSTTNKQTNTSIHRKIIAIIIIIDQIGVIIDFDGMSLSMHIAYVYICRHTIPSWLIEQTDAFGSNETGIYAKEIERNRNISISISYFRVFPSLPLSRSLLTCRRDLISGFAWLVIFFTFFTPHRIFVLSFVHLSPFQARNDIALC